MNQCACCEADLTDLQTFGDPSTPMCWECWSSLEWECGIPVNMNIYCLWIDPSELLHVPIDIEKCPECGAELVMDLFEYETKSRQVAEAGFHLSCIEEDEENPDTHHRHWQSDWQPTIDRVYRWMKMNVRVKRD